MARLRPSRDAYGAPLAGALLTMPIEEIAYG
jgi:hypothetical protein